MLLGFIGTIYCPVITKGMGRKINSAVLVSLVLWFGSLND